MWFYFDECPDIDEEQWARLDAIATRRAWDLMVYGVSLPFRRQGDNCALISALGVDIGGGDHRRGLRFAALSALLPTSSGSTTTD